MENLRWTKLTFKNQYFGSNNLLLPFKINKNKNSVPYIPLSYLIHYYKKVMGEEYYANATNCLSGNDYIGITIINKLDILKINWCKLRNGVIFIFPADNLLEATNRYHIRHSTDAVAVHILPLTLFATLVHWPILYDTKRIPDLRAFYQYGAKQVCGRVATYLSSTQIIQRVNCMYPRRTIVVYNEKILNHSDYCMKRCSNKIKWATRGCGFMSYNCNLASTLEPGMLKAPAPDFNNLFGEHSEIPNADCILRDNFEPYLDNNLLLELAQRDKVRLNTKDAVAKGSCFKKLRRLICPACWLYTNDRCKYGHMPCGRRPNTCNGPIFEHEVKQIKNIYNTIEPWEVHVLTSASP